MTIKYSGTKGLKSPQAIKWLNERFQQYDLNDSQTKQTEECLDVIEQEIEDLKLKALYWDLIEEKATASQLKYVLKELNKK